jgi:hypothetical protein
MVWEVALEGKCRKREGPSTPDDNVAIAQEGYFKM